MRTATQTGGRDATTRRISGDFALCVGEPTLPAPPGWCWHKLTDVARLESGHTPSRKHPEYWGGDVPWITLSDARAHDGGVIFDTIEQTNELGIANSSARILPASTVCLSRTASVGYVVVTGKPMATSQDFVNWICSDRLDPHFLRYLLIAERNSLGRFSSGAVHQTIYFPEVKAFHVCLPPIHQQRRIVAILDAAFEGIRIAAANAETNLANARELFERALTQHVDDVCRGGRTLTLADAVAPDCSLSYGIVQPGEEVDKGLPIVRPVDLTGRRIVSLQGLKRIDPALAAGYGRTTLQGGEILMCVRGTTGVVALAATELRGGNVTRGIVPIRFNPELFDPKFGLYQLRSHRVQKQIRKATYGAALMQINIRDLRSIELIAPPKANQRRVAALIEKTEAEALRLSEIYASQNEHLRAVRNSILSRAFSGELLSAPPVRAVFAQSSRFAANVIALAHSAHQAVDRARTFGTVKAQKHLHLVEELAGIDMGRDPIKDAAGPNDPDHFQRVRAYAEERGFFRFERRASGGHTFKKLANYDTMLEKAKRDLEPYRPKLDPVTTLLVPMDKIEAEILATVYAAWNNLLLDGLTPTPEDIVRAAREDWHPDKLRIDREKFFDAIKALKRRRIAPSGAGKRVRERHGLL